MLKQIKDVVRMQQLRERRRNECCRSVLNVRQIENARPDAVTEQCTTCGCKHHVLQAEKGVLGAVGAALGACLLVLVLSAPAAAQSSMPWTVYGQTLVACQSGINNPTPNVNGLVGEVSALPYTVPEGKELIIDAYGIESYATATGGLVLAPYIGPTPPIPNNAFLHSVYSNDASNETNGVEFHLQAGKVFNIRLMSSECPASVTGWYVKGRLISVATPEQ